MTNGNERTTPERRPAGTLLASSYMFGRNKKETDETPDERMLRLFGPSPVVTANRNGAVRTRRATEAELAS